MFERLLAALIILALLVLVMFIALPYTPGSERTSAPSVDQPAPPPAEKPAPPESARAKPPAAGQNDVVKNEAAPQPAGKPAAEAREPSVPNPPGNGQGNTNKAPAPAKKGEREVAGGDARVKQKFVKYDQDKLPVSLNAEPRPKPNEIAKADKPKAGKPKTDTVSRAPVQQPPRRVFIKGDRDRDDGIGDYIRRAGHSPPDWHRTHYYECADGRCDCSCDRPYWARRGPPCWD